MVKITTFFAVYMVPVCMPSLRERHRRSKNRFVFMVDYLSSKYCIDIPQLQN